MLSSLLSSVFTACSALERRSSREVIQTPVKVTIAQTERVSREKLTLALKERRCDESHQGPFDRTATGLVSAGSAKGGKLLSPPAEHRADYHLVGRLVERNVARCG